MALRLEMEEAEVVQENVESFPVAELIGRFMSPKYFIDLEVLDPLFYGMPVSRRRLYVKMLLDRMTVNQLSAKLFAQEIVEVGGASGVEPKVDLAQSGASAISLIIVACSTVRRCLSPKLLYACTHTRLLTS